MFNNQSNLKKEMNIHNSMVKNNKNNGKIIQERKRNSLDYQSILESAISKDQNIYYYEA